MTLLKPAASWALLAGAGAYWLQTLASEHLLDLRVYRSGAAALLHGGAIYAEHLDPTDPFHTPLNFTYPPFAALLFAPFALLPWAFVVAALTVAGIAALALTTRLVRPQAPLAAVVVGAMLLGPVGWPQGTLVMGQVNLLLMALVAADLLPAHRRWRGALTGIAAGVKLTPGIFLVYLAVTGRRREAATGAVTAAATALIGYAVAPGDSVLFWTRLWWDPAHVGDQAYTPNQSLGGALARLGAGHGVWLVLAAAVGAYGLAVARQAYRSGDELWGVLVTALTGLLVSPVSWLHHWVWAVPIALVLWARGAWVIATCWVAVFAVQPLWWSLPPPAHDLATNSVTLAGLALLAAAPYLILIMDRPVPKIGSTVWNRAYGRSVGASRSAARSGPVAATRPMTAWWLSTAAVRSPRWARRRRSGCPPTSPYSAMPGTGSGRG